MSYSAGSAFLAIVPSFAGAVESIDAEAAKWGESAGTAFKDSFETRVQDLNIGVDLNDADAIAKLDELKVDLDETGAKSPNIKVDVDAGEAIAELEAVKVAADDASGSAGGGGLAGLAASAGEAGPEISPLISTVLALGSALVPIAAVAVGVGLGLAGMGVAAAAGIGAFALAAMPVISQVETAYTQIQTDQTALTRATTTAQKNTALLNLHDDLANLNPTIATVVQGILGVKTAFMNWDAQFDPAILSVFNAALGVVQPLLTAITPLVYAGATALQQFFTAMGQVAQSSAFTGFMTWLATEVGPAISTLQLVFDEFAAGFATMLKNSAPLITIVEDGLASLSGQFDKMANSNGFKSFIDYVVKEGPAVGAFFIGLAGVIEPIIGALAKIGAAILPVIDAVLKWVGALLQAHPIIADIVVVIGIAIGAFALLTGAFALLAPVIAAATVVIGLILSPIGLLIAIVVAVGVAIGELVTHWSTVWGAIQGAADAAWQFMDSNVFQPIVNFFTVTIPGALDSAVNFFTGLPGRIVSALSSVFGDITGAFGDVAGWVSSNIIDPVENFFTGLPAGIAKAIGSAIGDLTAIGKVIIDALIDAINTAINFYDSHRPSLLGVSLLPAIPDIPKLHEGGFVPGSGDVLSVLQGGEYVLSSAMLGSLAGIRAMPSVSTSSSNSPTFNLTVNAPNGTAQEIAAAVETAVNRSWAQFDTELDANSRGHM